MMPDLLQELGDKLHALKSQTYPDRQSCRCDATRKYICSICAECALLEKCQDEIISLRDRLRAIKQPTE